MILVYRRGIGVIGSIRIIGIIGDNGRMAFRRDWRMSRLVEGVLY